MPNGLRGDVTLSYVGQFGRHNLVQNDQQVGQRRLNTHDFDVRFEFAPVNGISFYATLPNTVSKRLSFPQAYEMLVDPATGVGEYITSSPLDNAPEYTGAGSQGVWFGVGFAPYSEQFNASNQLTWRLDVAARTRAKKTFFTETDGKRGAALGGSAFLVSGAFSADNGTSKPYMKAAWTLETRRAVQFENNNGSAELQVKPGSTFRLTTGVEVLLLNPATDQSPEPYFDMNAGFGYRSWRNIPSGFMLPDVLDTAIPNLVTNTEALSAEAGIGFGLRFFPYLQWQAGLKAIYQTPYYIEDIYTVKTSADSFDWAFGTTLSFGYR